MAKLLLKHEGLTLNTISLKNDLISIGRVTGNDIQLDDPAVSGQHAQITREPNEYMEGLFDYFIEDLGSTNGTLVNNREITKQMLKDGDEIQIGNHHYRFDNEDNKSHETTAIYLPD